MGMVMGWGVGEWTPGRLISFLIFSVTRAHLGGLTYLWFTPLAHLTGQDDLSFPFLKTKQNKKPMQKPRSFCPFFLIFFYFGAHAHRFLFYKHSVVFVTWTHSGHVYST